MLLSHIHKIIVNKCLIEQVVFENCGRRRGYKLLKSPVSNRYVLFRSLRRRPSYQIPEILFLGIRLDHVSNAPNYNDSPPELAVRYQLKPESLGFVFLKLFDRTSLRAAAAQVVIGRSEI